MTKPYINVKWPALLVTGERVTRDQAAEILIRTNSWPCSSNSHEKDAVFNAIAGLPVRPENSASPEEGNKYWNTLQNRCEELGVLQLEYLHNARLTSSWVGGPYGWCDWDGQIWAANKNMGKWPIIKEVTDEWRRIAEAFPFLRLRAQVLDGEVGEETEAANTPTAEWIVADGKVELVFPTEILAVKVERELPINWSFRALLRNEVGATDEQVRRGVALALKRGGAPQGDVPWWSA